MKKYELTQEQINQLAEKKHAKELLKEFLPEAFENKLEVGKWYIDKGCLFNYQTKKSVYGFFTNNEWIDKKWKWTNNKGVRLATEEEVKEALINEAKKRGFNNIGDLKIKNTYGCIRNGYRTNNNNFYYDYISNTLQLDGVIIFRNGFWAEIVIEDIPTQEEIDRVINYLKNK